MLRHIKCINFRQFLMVSRSCDVDKSPIMSREDHMLPFYAIKEDIWSSFSRKITRDGHLILLDDSHWTEYKRMCYEKHQCHSQRKMKNVMDKKQFDTGYSDSRENRVLLFPVKNLSVSVLFFLQKNCFLLKNRFDQLKYCRVPEGRGLHQSPPDLYGQRQDTVPKQTFIPFTLTG